MRSLYHHALWLGLLALPACTPASTTPPAAAPAPTTASKPPPPAEPDLSPVSAPKGVVALGRWQNATGTLKAVERIGRLPFPMEMILQKQLGDKELVAVLKLDAAIDGVVIIDPASTPDRPKFLGAVSLPLQSMDKAMALASRAGKPVSVRPGVYRIGRMMDLVCDLSASVGDVNARLICSEHERDLDALVPWMTRGLPNEKLGAGDLHLETRAEGLRQQFQREIDQFAPLLPGLAIRQLRDLGLQQAGLLDIAAATAGDVPKLVADLDTLSLDMRLDGDKTEATVGGSVKFKGTSSWVSKLMTHRNDKSGPVPAVFWQMPKDSDSVAYTHGVDPKLFDGMREALASAVRGLLTGKVDGADAQAISDLFAKAPLVDSPTTVSARGHIEPPAPRTYAKPTDFKPADAIRTSQDQTRAALGWTVIGLETKSDVYVAWLKDLARTYNSRTLQTKLKKELGQKAADHMPVIKSVGAPKGSPAGSVAYEFSIPITSEDIWEQHRKTHRYSPHPKGAPAKGSLAVTVVVAADGNRTWLGIAGDPNALGSHLAAVKDGAPKDGTIAARTDLEALKSGNHTGGGFFTLDGIVASLRGSLGGTMSASERQMLTEGLVRLPNKGSTPVIVFTDGTTGAAPVNSFEMKVTKGTIDDAVSFAQLALMARPSAEPPPAVERATPAVPPPPPPAPRKK